MPRRRSSAHSPVSSSRNDRYLSVTQGLEDLNFGETAGDQYPSVPSPYILPSQGGRRRSLSRADPSSSYLPTPYDPNSATPYSSLEQYPAFDPSLEGSEDYAYPADPVSFSNSPLGRSSMSMSGPPPGPMLPSSILPSSTHGDFRDAGREVARQRRRNVEHSRRQEKMRMRRTAALLPSIQDPGSSQALEVSGYIDSLAAHSNSSYPHGSRSEYSSTSSMHEPYSGTIPRQGYSFTSKLRH
ncbi:MAG: hypothetical protein Q9164_003612 [Protoblastenia rupestris]